MDLTQVANVVQNSLVNSSIFPYRTGLLRANFLDKNIQPTENGVSFTVLSSPVVYYGKILQERASINYKTKHSTIRHKNRHFKYIDRIIETGTINEIENLFGVKRV